MSPVRQNFVEGVPVGRHEGDGSIGRDPRALRGGNIPSVFSIGHWLRDRRLTFSSDRVTIAPSALDSAAGDLSITDLGEDYDAIIVGSGMAGLASAFYLQRDRPGTRTLVLDCKPSVGGNAGRDDGPPLPVVASTGGTYAIAPYTDSMREFYRAIGLEWERHLIPDPVYSYFFDAHTPHVVPGTRRWALNVYGAGSVTMPYPPGILNDLERARRTFADWYHVPGGPMDPHDSSDRQYAHLARISLHDYLTGDLGLHPAVSDYYTRYSIDALAGTTHDVNAFTGISFLSAEYQPMFSPPGGTSAIARHLLQHLVPGSVSDDPIAKIRPEMLDRPDATVRVRQDAMVLRANTEGARGDVIYCRGGKLFRAHARAIVLAGQGYTARMIVDHLLDDGTRAAWNDFTFVPMVTANVALRRAAPLVQLGLGYDCYWWGSKYWADFVVADWTMGRPNDPERATVLTFFGANLLPPSEMPAERVKMLRAPFEVYERSLREDLQRVLADTDFDHERDITAICVYRWGHGMIMPKVGFPFGPHGNADDRSDSPRHIARRKLGVISFAGQDTEGSPGLESAVASGRRTASEALAVL